MADKPTSPQPDKALLDHAFQLSNAVIQHWFQEVVDLVESQTETQIPPLTRFRYSASGELNSSIAEVDGCLEVSISEKLVLLLKQFDGNLMPMGVDAAGREGITLDTSQRLLDVSLRMVFDMSPPQPLFPVPEWLGESKEFKEYQERHAELRAERFAKLQKQGRTDEALRSQFEPITQAFSDPISMSEWQVKFLLLHELSHFVLGHHGKPPSHEHEFEADRQAASLLFAHLKRERDLDPLKLAPVAILEVFLVVKFVEDLIETTNRATRFTILDGFKEGYVEIPYNYPPAHARVTRLLRSFAEDFNPLARSIASIMEDGLLGLKQDFRLGLIDLRYFKWYCRIRGQEMAAAFMTRRLEPSARVVKMLEFQRGWDTADLTRGPLFDEIFGPRWHETLFWEEEA